MPPLIVHVPPDVNHPHPCVRGSGGRGRRLRAKRVFYVKMVKKCNNSRPDLNKRDDVCVAEILSCYIDYFSHQCCPTHKCLNADFGMGKRERGVMMKTATSSSTTTTTTTAAATTTTTTTTTAAAAAAATTTTTTATTTATTTTATTTATTTTAATTAKTTTTATKTITMTMTMTTGGYDDDDACSPDCGSHRILPIVSLDMKHVRYGLLRHAIHPFRCN